ncbi:hypothetical protein J3R83DRAFT_12509 [Lanmaoa asiatica]|nr:hypothetical protein J3R83DRAFT_12509 [Lanmaoa asiatica]
MIGFWNLMIVWLKLLLPWRFFRLWSPSQWDRSAGEHDSMYGKQLLHIRFLAKLAPFVQSMDSAVMIFPIPSRHPLTGGRYIYVPLGGTKSVAITTALIFTFVALWHDLSFRLLAWGWLVSVFILPELLAATLLPQSKYGRHTWYRHVCACGGVLNVLTMIAANLVGFVIGTDGILYMANQITGSFQGNVIERFLFFNVIFD